MAPLEMAPITKQIGSSFSGTKKLLNEKVSSGAGPVEKPRRSKIDQKKSSRNFSSY